MLSVSGCGTDQTSSKPSTPAEPNEAVETNPASETAKGPAAETSSESGATARIVEGRATWYGPGLYGNNTASGDVLQEGTVIDLAHGAADALDIDDDGTANVSIEVMD